MKSKTSINTTIRTLVFSMFCLLSASSIAADDAGSAISAAKEAQKKAGSVGGEWRDVGKFIKGAEKAAKEGDAKKATKLANKAKAQAESGYKQATSEQTIAKDFPSYFD